MTPQDDITDNTVTEAPSVAPTDVPAADAPMADASATDTPVADVLPEVVAKIGEAHNILVALSGDPSVDEMAAAIGISLFLDRLGKRATAIYSGATPNALEFLNPEETFENTADILQDFVIALSKEKADHLRYKLDGEFVKIYITPYKEKVSEEDLEFSYGDYNVDLVLALDVANGIDLDAALREHGRIMHDASIVNITTGKPGKFGEIEWSDSKASSVSEMLAKMVYSMTGKVQMGKEEATAFLTGIVAATNRFSNARTTSETMKMASRLMESGANQQLVSKNITPDVDNELYSLSMGMEKRDNDATKLDVEHGNEQGVDETKVVDTDVNEVESSLLDDLKAAEASLAGAAAEVVPEEEKKPLDLGGSETTEVAPEATAEVVSEAEAAPEIATEVVSEPEPEPVENMAANAAPAVETIETPVATSPEVVIQPPEGMDAMTLENEADRYGKMLEEALKEGNTSITPEVPAAPEMSETPAMPEMPAETEILPPPPAPIAPAMPEMPPEFQPLGEQPAMQDQVYAPAANDPAAFKIPTADN